MVQYDTPASLLYQPKNEFVENFVGADRALKGLQLIRVKEIMTSSPPLIEADQGTATVEQRMQYEGIDWLVVVDDEGKFLGWVDRANLAAGQLVSDIMNSSPTTATANAVLSEALSLMLSSGLKTLAIVDRANKVEGMLSFDAIQKALSEIAQRGEAE